MCGIAGIWAPKCSPSDRGALIDAMTATLRTRGPDSDGTWHDDAACLALGHRRLAVVDLSAEGRQPMLSPSGRYCAAYNGEIYNAEDLRRELGSASFRGHSDTEVALACFDAWGIDAACERFVGMFAFAVWDRSSRRLTLVRDRLGIKPLYYADAAGDLLVSSQPKAFWQHPDFSRELSSEALAAYVERGVVPAPMSIFCDAKQVEAGTTLTFDAPSGPPQAHVYWNVHDVTAARVKRPTRTSEAEMVAQLDALLTEAVRCRLVADVPLGAFLSGGIDSSTVVSLMQKVSRGAVKTFTIGTSESSHDESLESRRVAAHLGTEHHEFIVSPREALEVVDELPEHFDEPFADSSQVPSLLVSRLAREHVTVCLSGDGGDELFGGYNRHLWGPRVVEWRNRIPPRVRDAFLAAVEAVSPGMWTRIYETIRKGRGRIRLPSDKLSKLASALQQPTPQDVYYDLLTGRVRSSEVLVPALARSAPRDSWPDFAELAHQFMYADMTGYLPDDILTKVDRASMAVGLEARVPILDHRVVEFAWSLPFDVKIRDGRGKYILRQLLSRYLPRELFERPKSGFGVPVAAWLRGPLRALTEELSSEAQLSKQGLFAVEPLQQKVREHLTGRRDWSQHLWTMLMFQKWWEHMTQAQSLVLTRRG